MSIKNNKKIIIPAVVGAGIVSSSLIFGYVNYFNNGLKLH